MADVDFASLDERLPAVHPTVEIAVSYYIIGRPAQVGEIALADDMQRRLKSQNHQ